MLGGGKYAIRAEVDRILEQWIVEEGLEAFQGIPIKQPRITLGLVWGGIDTPALPRGGGGLG
jgi:hypothetical protein